MAKFKVDGKFKKKLHDMIKWHVVHSCFRPWDMRRPEDIGPALVMSLRDIQVEEMLKTRRRYQQKDVKWTYYLSIEYLPGRLYTNNVVSMNLHEVCAEVMHELDVDMEWLAGMEADKSLGNGGLGRLASCYMDSLATLGIPAMGYGLRYEAGLFKQAIVNGYQKELPDFWMRPSVMGQLPRYDNLCEVHIYGRIVDEYDSLGEYKPLWVDTEKLYGVPYDMPIVGYGGETVNIMRLFAAKAANNLNMDVFNVGDYVRAVEDKILTETVSKVLYPREDVAHGRLLRLIQEYFLVACSLYDLTRRYQESRTSFEEFPEKVAIQLNDTHPALAVAELMRILVDLQRIPWDKAWEITTKTLAYTNHTLMPEALEVWPVELLEQVLPRHLQIIYEINRRFLDRVTELFPGDVGRLQRMSLVQEGPEKMIRMGHLSVVGSHSVNGVSALHSELVKTRLFPDFNEIWPERFNNKTNGITPRLWLYQANEKLATLLCDTLGEAWVTDLYALKELERHKSDTAFLDKYAAIKLDNKIRLASFIKQTQGIVVAPDSLFDAQCKRIHEYKRQLLNCLNIVHQYLRIVEDGFTPVWSRTWLFAGKAAPGYFEAKGIIKFINNLAKVIDADHRTRDLLKIVFLPDYRVSLAERIMPATEVSEQISTAGTEASGTGNMKFALNSALTIGTWDGANIEIAEEVGMDNIYIFGLRFEDIEAMEARGDNRPYELYQQHEDLRRVLDAIVGNRFSPDEPDIFRWIYDKLLTPGERYFHLADFHAYVSAHDQLLLDYADRKAWTKRSVLNVARMGKFSSDRAIREYAHDIWNTQPVD